MTNAAPEKVALLHIPISLIDVKEQVRKKFDEKAHKELTESIRKLGDVISPVTVRRGKKDGRFELVAGERRLRAAKAAGLTGIATVVRDLDDQAAALYQVEENIHRKDLTPIEEARGFRLLTQPQKDGTVKYTVDQLRLLVDKSLGYVYRAVNLLELPEIAISKIEDGTLTPAHGHQLLRVPPFEREALLKSVLEDGYDGRIMTAVELKEQIDHTLSSDLSAAKFPKDKPYAGMSACNGCPSNTANQTALFDGIEKGTCTNKQCFTTKEKQLKADFLDATKLAHLDAKFVEYGKGWVGEGWNRTGGWSVKEKLSLKNAKGNYGIVIGLDRELWLAVQTKESQKPSEAAPQPVTEKDRFIAANVNEQLEALTTEKIKTAGPKTMLAAINASLKEGYQGRQLKAAGLFPITAANVLKVYFQDRMEEGYYNAEKRLTALGLNLKKETATLAKAATEKWDKEHPVKPVTKSPVK